MSQEHLLPAGLLLLPHLVTPAGGWASLPPSLPPVYLDPPPPQLSCSKEQAAGGAGQGADPVTEGQSCGELSQQQQEGQEEEGTLTDQVTGD
jgi:hypothetical protein